MAALVVATGSGLATAAPSAAADAEQGYIVVLNDGVQNADAIAAAHGKKFGFAASQTYKNALSGYAGNMTAAKAKSLATDPSVEFVAKGRQFRRPPDPAPPNTEIAPFSWLRMGQTLDGATAGDGRNSVQVNTAVIDSGIDGTQNWTGHDYWIPGSRPTRLNGLAMSRWYRSSLTRRESLPMAT